MDDIEEEGNYNSKNEGEGEFRETLVAFCSVVVLFLGC
jgi:hypothetical protein